MIQQKRRPATAATADRSKGIDQQLDGQINTRTARTSQASSFPADVFGETDLAYFTARPNIDRRCRVAFDGEPPEALRDFENDVAFIKIKIERGPDGRPATIRREIVFGTWGTA